ncbi:MAG TPA: MBOAT family O-acyltransferase [Anaerolineales bacterium]
MSVLQVFILAGVAILVNLLRNGRSLVLMGVSALAIYWLQPWQQPVNLTFWFPTLTLALVVVFWMITSAPEARDWKHNLGAVVILLVTVILVDLNRYIKIEEIFITDTPRVQAVIVALLGVGSIVFVLAYIKKLPPLWYGFAIVGLIVMLVFLKAPSVWENAFRIVAEIRGKEPAGVPVISWLGFSYVAFRLMHTALDRLAGRLPAVTLPEYVNYVIFFPSFTAGPIERLERFVRNTAEPIRLDSNGWVEAGTRLFRGLFKKFVIADGLAWFALSDFLVPGVQSVGWTWILLYAYSLRIYFDFSGYTDIAIGLAMLMGIRLPENFNAPYLKPNITQFWNSWHITLTQWFRSYFFNPLVRMMRSTEKPLQQWLMIFFAQASTMMLIGLWHGMTPGFLLWGLWHGLGLFIHNRWSEWTRSRLPAWVKTGKGEAVLRYSGVFLTFHYVTVGWLFFFLPDPATAWGTLLRLFGAA